MKGLLKQTSNLLTRLCPKDDSVETWFDCASGGINGILLEVHIAFYPLANLPVWMGQGK